MKRSFYVKFLTFTTLIFFILTFSAAYAVSAPNDITKHWAKAAINSANYHIEFLYFFFELQIYLNNPWNHDLVNVYSHTHNNTYQISE
jgi:hypothetical protein